jgi:hypothetical protein
MEGFQILKRRGYIYQTRTDRESSDHRKCSKPLVLSDVVLQLLMQVIGMSRGAKWIILGANPVEKIL